MSQYELEMKGADAYEKKFDALMRSWKGEGTIACIIPHRSYVFGCQCCDCLPKHIDTVIFQLSKETRGLKKEVETAFSTWNFDLYKKYSQYSAYDYDKREIVNTIEGSKEQISIHILRAVQHRSAEKNSKDPKKSIQALVTVVFEKLASIYKLKRNEKS